jgi:hypothetical protein
MQTASGSKLRGTIIKVPDNTPGLLFANGQQRPFVLDGLWRSPVAPAANMVVEMELDASGAISSLAVVDSQQIAREKLSQFGGVAQEQGKQAAEIARMGVGALAGRMGTAALVSAVGIWIAWFLLPVFSVSIFLVNKSFTFWELLGVDLSNPVNLGTGGNQGLFGLIGLAAIAAPFAAPFLRHPRARRLNLLPLAFLILTLAQTAWTIARAVGSAQSAMGGEAGQFASQMAEQAMKAMLDAISIGAGAYVLAIASIVLATQAFKNRQNA